MSPVVLEKTDRSSAWAMLVAAALAFLALSQASKKPSQNYEDFALGELTTSIFPEVDGFPVHTSELANVPSLVSGWKARGQHPVVLWLGNSQLHAINQAEHGARPVSIRCFERFQPLAVDVLTFSVPNANFQEHYVLLENLRQQLPIKTIILPIVFDDFRESGIRDSLAPALDDAATQFALQDSETGRRLITECAPIQSSSDHLPQNGFVTLQDRSEEAIDFWLAEHSRIYAARGQMRGAIVTELYLLRNRIFGITSQSVRRKIPGRYALNRAALVAILESARQLNMKVITYIVPLRQDVASPYDRNEYTAFKDDMKLVTSNHCAQFNDLDSLVAGELWGKMSDIQGNGEGFDFMHFQEEGHALLAKEIGNLLISSLPSREALP